MTFYAKKQFGQHFLRDRSVIQRIIATLAPQPHQHFVEIGPGQGALTFSLLAYQNRLDVIEIDAQLVNQLQQQVLTHPQLHVHQGDALHFDLHQLMIAGESLRIIGNLPYNISTPLLFHLCKYLDSIQDMTLMLQKEVVERMVATPSSKIYGRLSVMIQYYCQVEKLFDVSPTAFYPQPQVVSSVVYLSPHSVPPVAIKNQLHFSELVTAAFAKRRKTLRNALKELLDSKEMIDNAVDPQYRAENLNLADFARLANALSKKREES